MERGAVQGWCTNKACASKWTHRLNVSLLGNGSALGPLEIDTVGSFFFFSVKHLSYTESVFLPVL